MIAGATTEWHGAPPARLRARLRQGTLRAIGLALIAAGCALGSVTLLERAAAVLHGHAQPWAYELVVHLGALLLPLTLLPLLHAARAAARTERLRRDARLAAGATLSADATAVTVNGRAIAWPALHAIDVDDGALVLTVAPEVDRPLTERVPLPEAAASLAALRATPPDDTGARALDHEIFTAACAGRELPPGCFVVRRRRAASVGLLLTPRALLVREGDAYRRVPWRWIASAELGSPDPHEFVPSDLLIARDAAGRALASVACRPLSLPADALCELVRARIVAV